QGSATPVVAEDGHRYGSVFTFRDITEQKRTEEARFALAALVESSSDAILRISVDGVITGWDRGCERLYGYSAAEAIGQSVTLAMFPDRRDELPRLLARLRHGETIEHFETIRRHKDGHLVEISATASPIRDATGKITGFVSIAHDI